MTILAYLMHMHCSITRWWSG